MKLSKEGVQYSRNERAVFAAIPKTGKQVSTTQLVDRVYRNRPGPTHGRQVVLATLAHLERKAKANREPFVIKRTQRSGPHPLRFWLEAK